MNVTNSQRLEKGMLNEQVHESPKFIMNVTHEPWIRWKWGRGRGLISSRISKTLINAANKSSYWTNNAELARSWISQVPNECNSRIITQTEKRGRRNSNAGTKRRRRGRRRRRRREATMGTHSLVIRVGCDADDASPRQWSEVAVHKLQDKREQLLHTHTKIKPVTAGIHTLKQSCKKMHEEHADFPQNLSLVGAGGGGG